MDNNCLSSPGLSQIAQGVELREVVENDLPIFFENQLDPTANYMAAFTSKDPADREAFDAHWKKILADETIPIKTILFGNHVAGSVLSYEMGGEREVSYWLGKEYWGQGIATRALGLYLEMVQQCPMYARAAKDNLGSIRVLEKCGFKPLDSDKGFANARGKEIEEVIMIIN
jgi:RimJ/RimL family protein N-acetyltransferase